MFCCPNKLNKDDPPFDVIVPPFCGLVVFDSDKLLFGSDEVEGEEDDRRNGSPIIPNNVEGGGGSGLDGN